MRFVKRVASSNARVTKGQLYLYDGEHITDDLGDRMRPNIKPQYWELVENPIVGFDGIRTTINDAVKNFGHINCRSTIDTSQIACASISASQIACASIGVNELFKNSVNKLEELKMAQKKLTIKTVTYINDAPVEAYTVEDLVALIKTEMAKVETLNSIPARIKETSHAVRKLLEKHEANIAQLVELMEKLEA